MRKKRILIATLFGFIAGIFCYLSGVILIPIEHDLMLFIWVVVNRTLLGFVIGISALRVHWALNGLIVGLTVGLVFPLNAVMLGKEIPLIISVYVMGIIYGILIEFFTSVVFKQKALQ
jgi:hypothetical protein